MGVYCACNAKLSRNEQTCTCDWKGWTEIKSENDKPKNSGIYLCRYCDNSGDCHEEEMKFSLTPFRIDKTIYGRDLPIHWEKESWDDNTVYAFKEN